MEISVIVPVYNVKEWIDECMESIVNQTFTDFEVILIDDGSTDGSGEKCDKWAENDERVKVYHKLNEGLSPTRNFGINKAMGKFLSFIDPDDWVDLSFFEKMIKKQRDSNVEIIETDLIKYNQNTKKTTYKMSSGNIGIEESLEDHMIYGNTTLNKCLISKRLFDDYDIKFPECHSPARSIYAILLALSNGIANVNEGLYFYRTFRPGSLTECPRKNIETTEIGIKAFTILLKESKRVGVYTKYRDIILHSIRYKMSDILNVFYNRLELNDYKRMRHAYYDSEKMLLKKSSVKYLSFGSYNLSRITWSMNNLHDPYTRFNFSSISSVVFPTQFNKSEKHPNIYREKMIERDIKSMFWDILDEIKPQYLIVDLIEERYPLIKIKDGYITKSEAIDEICDLSNYDKIDFGTEERMDIWEKTCDVFSEKIRKYNVKVILVENYLSKEYGNINAKQVFNCIENIDYINDKLKSFYTIFSEKISNVITVNTSSEMYFTDEKYIYGVKPENLNDIVNREIGKKIELILDEDKNE